MYQVQHDTVYLICYFLSEVVSFSYQLYYREERQKNFFDGQNFLTLEDYVFSFRFSMGGVMNEI